MSRRNVEGQNTAKIKDSIRGQKILWDEVGLDFLFSSLLIFEVNYKNMQCSRDRSVCGVEVSILAFFFLLVSCLWAGTCYGCYNVSVDFKPILACKKCILQGETCSVRQGYRKRLNWNLRQFTQDNSSGLLLLLLLLLT